MVITNYRIAANVPRLRTIAVIADLHDRGQEVIRKSLNSRKPSIIAIPGDLISSELTDTALSFLSACAAIAPTFYSLGNHEYHLKPEDIAKIRKTGAVLLDDTAVQVGDITVGGLTTGYRFQREQLTKERMAGLYIANPEPNLNWLMAFSELSGFKVLLCHHVEYYPKYIKQTAIDLTLAGHAHGGQIRLGNQGLFAPNQGFFPKWTSGVHDGRLVISRGLANTAAWIPRLGNPPELVYVTIG